MKSGDFSHISDSLEAARWRSEETMHSNYFDRMILGTIQIGQGIANAVEGTHRSKLRVLVAKFARRLAMRLASWPALVRTPGAMTPATVTCPSDSAARRQREQRWMPGVVETRGTVGVC